MSPNRSSGLGGRSGGCAIFVQRGKLYANNIMEWKLYNIIHSVRARKRVFPEPIYQHKLLTKFTLSISVIE